VPSCVVLCVFNSSGPNGNAEKKSNITKEEREKLNRDKLVRELEERIYK
jgi:hypothetical protein